MSRLISYGGDGCGFCETLESVYNGDESNARKLGVRRVWPDAILIRPRRGGVHPLHVMVVPRAHVVDAIAQPVITGAMFTYGAQYLQSSWTSVHDWHMAVNIGSDAGQTAPHLHVHLWPREAGDRLCMPWDCRSGQAR